MSKDLLSTLGDALEALETHIDQFEKDAQQKIDGGKRVFEQYGDVLFADDATELSVMGQTMVSKMSTKAVNDAASLVTNHKALHAPVSKVGKEIERRMTKEVRELLRGEKDLEGDPRYQRLVERMISDHLMSTGFSGAAQVLDKEASLNGTLDQLPYDKDAVEAVMAAMENHDATPAIRWLEENAPQELHLKCDLIKQVIVEHLRQGNKEQAMEGMKVLATLGYEREMKEVAGALVLGSDCPRYQKLFSMQTWPALIARLSQVVYQLDSTLEDVVSTGVTTCMQLMKIKKRMEGRKDHIFSTEELPVSVSLKKCVHNLFTCPILKQQCTENNPPMKLHCGHVISRDAMHKLSSNTRNLRVKCPYCPSEASIADAKPVYF